MPVASYSSTSAWKNGRVSGVEPAPCVGLLRAGDGLPARGDDPLRDALGEPGLDRCEALGHERHPLGDDLPVVARGPRHQVEHHAHVLDRAAQHAEVAEPLAGVVLLERELEPLPQHLGGDAVGVGFDGRGVERSQGGAIVLGALVAARGGVVGHLVVVAGDALAGRAQRIERSEALHVAVGELEHRRWCAHRRFTDPRGWTWRRADGTGAREGGTVPHGRT